MIGADVVIPMGTDRRPVLPEGVRATLAHDDTWAVAVATRDEAIRALGIDIEPDERLEAELVEIILRPDHRDLAGIALDARLAFTLKEAAYKAWSAAGGRVLDHHDVRLTASPTTFSAHDGTGALVAGGTYTAAAGRLLALAYFVSTDDRREGRSRNRHDAILSVSDIRAGGLSTYGRAGLPDKGKVRMSHGITSGGQHHQCVDRCRTFPVSCARAIWLDEQVHPGTVAHHVTHAVRLTEDLDVERFRRGLQHVVDSNEMLRATLAEVDGTPVQTVHADVRVDFRSYLTVGWDYAQIAARLSEEAQRPFDPSTDRSSDVCCCPVGRPSTWCCSACIT